MLQKNIRYKSGFSHVKTHRVPRRLAERGRFFAEKYYDTNKITFGRMAFQRKEVSTNYRQRLKCTD